MSRDRARFESLLVTSCLTLGKLAYLSESVKWGDKNDNYLLGLKRIINDKRASQYCTEPLVSILGPYMIVPVVIFLLLLIFIPSLSTTTTTIILGEEVDPRVIHQV